LSANRFSLSTATRLALVIWPMSKSLDETLLLRTAAAVDET
jgi:hypothetical protein